MARSIIVDVCPIEPSARFICGVWGEATIDELSEIEKLLMDDEAWPKCPDGAEVVRLRATWNAAQVDWSEGIPRVAIPEHWDLALVWHRALEIPHA